MRRFMGMIALASGAAAGGVWGCGSAVRACVSAEECGDSEDASTDGPLVQGVLPEAASDEERITDGGKSSHDEDGAKADRESDGATDSATEDGEMSEEASESSTPDAGPCTPGAPPSQNGCITDANSVFVATAKEGGSDTAGTGSMAQPFATITRALANLGSSTAIYVCGGGYVDQVTLNVPVSLYGGLTCAGGVWAYLVSAVAVVTGSSASFALRIAVTTGAVDVEDMEVEGATAGAGESSIAAWVDASSNVALHRVKIVAGIGGAGADASAAAPNYAAATAPPGGSGVGLPPLGSELGEPTAVGGINTCADNSKSQGGLGGGNRPAGAAQLATPTSGTPSYDTAPFAPDPPANTGAGGSEAFDGCGATYSGSDGEGGGSAGAPAVSGGWSLALSAWIPSVSGKGGNGGVGQGGGGGDYGGGEEGNSIGAGAGGAGGCGGAGGLGGTSGGASFGLLSVNSAVTLDRCDIAGGLAGSGGTGGDGESGQNPGAGGPGGPGATNCSGAPGGYGQGGGGGAGGNAGASAALAYVGTKPTYGSDTLLIAFATPGTPGMGGAPGASDTALLAGDPNLAASGTPGVATTPLAVMMLPTQ